MVEVFKTNVRGADEARIVLATLLQHFPGSAINFDLEDCDKILRVKYTGLIPTQVTQLVNKLGFACEVLTD